MSDFKICSLAERTNLVCHLAVNVALTVKVALQNINCFASFPCTKQSCSCDYLSTCLCKCFLPT